MHTAMCDRACDHTSRAAANVIAHESTRRIFMATAAAVNATVEQHHFCDVVEEAIAFRDAHWSTTYRASTMRRFVVIVVAIWQHYCRVVGARLANNAVAALALLTNTCYRHV
jgi:hypothetical protein